MWWNQSIARLFEVTVCCLKEKFDEEITNQQLPLIEWGIGNEIESKLLCPIQC